MDTAYCTHLGMWGASQCNLSGEFGEQTDPNEKCLYPAPCGPAPRQAQRPLRRAMAVMPSAAVNRVEIP